MIIPVTRYKPFNNFELELNLKIVAETPSIKLSKKGIVGGYS